jgi:hypothetical protein
LTAKNKNFQTKVHSLELELESLNNEVNATCVAINKQTNIFQEVQVDSEFASHHVFIISHLFGIHSHSSWKFGMSSYKRKRDELDDSDDEEPSFGRQILPVANLPEDFNGIPTDGMQYLFTVRCVINGS